MLTQADKIVKNRKRNKLSNTQNSTFVRTNEKNIQEKFEKNSKVFCIYKKKVKQEMKFERNAPNIGSGIFVTRSTDEGRHATDISPYHDLC